MEFPESVHEVARNAARRHPADIPAAIDEAVAGVEALEEYEALVNDLVRHAVQGLVYDCRHESNRRIRAAAGAYGGPARIDHASAGVAGAYAAYYDFAIAGTTLGRLTGRDLPGVAESERMLADGHGFRARLCEALAPLVPADRTVQEAVSGRRLAAIFRRCGDEQPLAAAGD